MSESALHEKSNNLKTSIKKESTNCNSKPQTDLLQLVRSILGEFICTSFFLFAAMASGVNLAYSTLGREGGTASLVVGHLVSGLTVGFVAVAIIYSFGHISGAHFNPAVTFGALVAGKLNPVKAVGYWIAQLFASLLATSLIYSLFPGDGTDTLQMMIVTIPEGGSRTRAFFMELILTFILVFVIFATAIGYEKESAPPKITQLQFRPDVEAGGRDIEIGEDENEGLFTSAAKDNENEFQRTIQVYSEESSGTGPFAAIAIGLTLGFLCYLGGSVSGGAFNPARVFGPALLSLNFSYNYIYWLGDFAGAALAAIIYTISFSSSSPLLGKSKKPTRN